MMKPAAKRYRALADMAASYGVVNGVKKKKDAKAQAMARRATTPIKGGGGA